LTGRPACPLQRPARGRRRLWHWQISRRWRYKAIPHWPKPPRTWRRRAAGLYPNLTAGYEGERIGAAETTGERQGMFRPISASEAILLSGSPPVDDKTNIPCQFRIFSQREATCSVCQA
jgi:hypothetical protein